MVDCRQAAHALLRLLIVSVLQAAIDAAPASAQAWLPEKGVGAVSFQYQNVLVTDHYFGSTRVDVGHIRSHDLVVDASYGLNDRLAVRFTVPLIVSKYDGDFPHAVSELPNYDTGRYHGTLQDLRFDFRYALTPGHSVAVTPFVNVIVPSHDYFYFAHSAPGVDLREVQAGAYVARMLDPIAPPVFVQARVAYGVVERVLGFSHNRTYADLEVGYLVKPGFRVFLAGSSMATHGGIDFPATTPRVALLSLGDQMGVGDAVWVNHDRIGHEQSVNVALGTSIALRPSLDVFGSVASNVFERNGHSMKHGFGMGVTWHTAGHDPLRDLRGGSAKRAIARCVCK